MTQIGRSIRNRFGRKGVRVATTLNGKSAMSR